MASDALGLRTGLAGHGCPSLVGQPALYRAVAIARHQVQEEQLLQGHGHTDEGRELARGKRRETACVAGAR